MVKCVAPHDDSASLRLVMRRATGRAAIGDRGRLARQLARKN